MWNKLIILIEVIVLRYFASIIYLDWYLNANVRDIFSMMIISEIGIKQGRSNQWLEDMHG